MNSVKRILDINGYEHPAFSIFELSMTGEQDATAEWTDEERDFLFEDGIPIVRNYEDFKVGLVVPDKLRPVRIKGGVVLMDTTYELR